MAKNDAGKAKDNAGAGSDRLLVGTAVETMTPPVGAKLAGYPGERVSDGVALELCVRAVVFAEEGKKKPDAAIAVLDTIGVTAELVKEMRKAAADALPGMEPETLMVCATHTHSAARLYSFRSKSEDPGGDDPYVQDVVRAVARAVAAAWDGRRLCTARVGQGEAYLGHNRRVVDMEGDATNEWLDAEGLHIGYFNPLVRVVAFEDAESGEPYAVIDSYGCHPVVMGPPNVKISPDYPGYLARAVEAATGARTAIHITAGGANINPRECLCEDPVRAEAMGEALAQEIVSVIPGARPIATAPVVSVSKPVSFLLGPNAGDRHKERATEGPDGPAVTSEVQVVRVGDLAFVSAPGELFAEIANTMRNRSPFKYTVVASCTDDALGYLSTRTAQREGGYEARRAISADIEGPLTDAAREALMAAYAVDR